MLKNLLLPLSLIVATLGCLSSSDARMKQVKKSNSLSQLVRSNASDYWAWASHKVRSTHPSERYVLNPWLIHTGVVMGDPHIGNFSVRESSFKNDEVRLIYRPVDFDDVGVAPFVIDVAKFVVATKAVLSDFKIKTLVKHYVKGLKNQEPPKTPLRVSKALSLSHNSLYSKNRQEVRSHTKDKSFAFKKGKLEKFYDPNFELAVKTFYPRAEVLSVAKRILKRGGSVKAERIWVLIGSGSDKKIIEFKELIETSVSAYSAQESTAAEMITPVFNYFLPDLAMSEYLVLNYKDKTFWMREKRASLIDNSFNVSKSRGRDEFKDMSKFASFLLGRVHGRQLEAGAFIKAIDEHGESVLTEAVRILSDPYLKSIKQRHSQFK